MVEGVSVMRIRDRGEGADLDIFWRGDARDIMRFVGAEDLLELIIFVIGQKGYNVRDNRMVL